jgi:rhodanese-related sulfurtransferase
MTSSQESSDRARKPNKPPEIESLAGAFHPHAIEVQDFSHYALVIDVRTPQEYEDDHIPGAVQFSPAVVSQGPLVTGTPTIEREPSWPTTAGPRASCRLHSRRWSHP